MTFAQQVLAVLRSEGGVSLSALAIGLATDDDPIDSVMDRLLSWTRADTRPPLGIQCRRCGMAHRWWMFAPGVTLGRTIHVFESSAGRVKICTRCGLAWPLSCYTIQPSGAAGRDNRCNECRAFLRLAAKLPPRGTWPMRRAVHRRMNAEPTSRPRGLR